MKLFFSSVFIVGLTTSMMAQGADPLMLTVGTNKISQTRLIERSLENPIAAKSH
jgi:hypothetical protein